MHLVGWIMKNRELNDLQMDGLPAPVQLPEAGEAMAGVLTILVDDREAGSPVLARLREEPEVLPVLRRLTVGDYRIESGLIFERKTIPDMTASITDGRLFRQARQLAAQPAGGAIILEGSGSAWREGGMSREAVQGALITVSLFMGVPLLRARDAEETARLLIYAARQVRRRFDHGLPRPGRRPKRRRQQLLWILQGIPHIGPVRAQALLATFGSIAGVCNAPAEKLARVPGIGRRIAANLHTLLRSSG